MLAQVLSLLIFLRAILSWFPIDRGSPLVVALDQVTEPILEPLRRIIPRIGMIDITPLVAILLLQLIAQAFSRSV